MKRWLWLIGAAVAVAVLSGNASPGKDVGKLQPVEVVYLACREGGVAIETDTGDLGIGANLAEAMEDMKAAAPGEVFLETADHLLLSPECIDLMPALMSILRPSCSVCLTEGAPDMEQVGLFLRVHRPRSTLARYRAGERGIETLVTGEGRMELVS